MIKRRDFIIGAGVVAAAGAMMPNVITVKPARAAENASQVAGFYRTKVGGITVTALLDGGMQLPQEILTGAKAEEIEDAKKKFFVPEGKSFPAFVNGYLIENGSKKILVDTGGAGFGPTLGNLSRNLGAAGVTPDDIDEVFLTHAHPDHANGLLDAGGLRVFKNAALRVSRAEVEYWTQNGKETSQNKDMFASARKNLEAYRGSGQIETFAPNADFGGGVSAVSLAGHTPGHSGVRVTDGRDQLLIWADLIHIPAIQFANPAQGVAFDVDIDAARATRLKIMDEVASDKIRVAGMHLFFPGIGHVAKNGNGYEFVPQVFETDV